jgi:threonyl-tRNA synthetase
MPELFELEYITESGKPARPVMIHRAMLGSLERFLGVYIEHCAGAFPTWLAPVQAIVIGISEHQAEYVHQMARTLTDTGFRVETDLRNQKVGYKIREAETKKIPFMAVAGAREMEAGDVSVRRHGEGDRGNMTIGALIEAMNEEIAQANP